MVYRFFLFHRRSPEAARTRSGKRSAWIDRTVNPGADEAVSGDLARLTLVDRCLNFVAPDYI
jgi:hypothetical protein